MAATRGLFDPVALSGLNSFLADLATLPRVRAAVDSGADNVVTTYRAYDKISLALWEFLHISAPPSDSALSTVNQSAVAVVGLGDDSYGAVSLIEAALAAGGTMTQPERTLFTQVVAQQNLLLADTFTLASPAIKPLYVRAFDSPVYRQLLAVETKIENSPPNRPIPVSPQAFEAIGKGLAPALQAPLIHLGADLGAQSASLGDSLVTQLALAGGLGLIAVVASAFVAVRFGRSIRTELTSLRDGAGVMAHERLPRVIQRLRGRRRGGRGGGVAALARREDHRDRLGRRSFLHRAAHRGRGGRGPGQPAQGRQPGLPEPVAAQPVAAAPPARHARLDGAGHQRAQCAGRPVPP